MNRLLVGIGLLVVCGSSAMNLTFGLAVGFVFLNVWLIRILAKKTRVIEGKRNE